ncbi:MAG: cell division protein FtsI/penicillin-binding protein 2 [Myxococcota bacterium]|jgi:cell division protein FtsI/penicillin-binding protein 2
MVIIGCGLALAIVAAATRAVLLQTTQADALQREAARNYVRHIVLDDWRGDLTDRNDNLMAVTVHRWSIVVDPSQIKKPAETAKALASILGKPAAELHARIDPATAQPTDEQSVKNPATHLARAIVTPMARMMTRMWGVPRTHIDRRLDLLERFFQLEQLQSDAVFGVVETIADAAEDTSAAIAGDSNSLKFFATRGRRFAYVARDLDDATYRAIMDARDAARKHCRARRKAGEKCVNPLQHISARPEPRRYYPKRQLAAQVIGLVGRESNGLSGIERAMDGVLRGKEHRVRAIRDKQGRRIFLEGLPEDIDLAAATVQLTLDDQIQAVAERELAKSCLSSGARAGYAVVMSVKTGEILAVANFPTYNPNTFQEWFRDRQPLKDERLALAQRRRNLQFAASWDLNKRAFPGQHKLAESGALKALDREVDAFVEYQHRFPNASRNTAFLDVYEPGSIMKVFTVAMALEEGAVNLSDTFDLEDGEWELHDADDNIIHDVSRLREGDLALILKKSSNIGAAKLAFLEGMGPEVLERYLHDFGFGAPTKSGFPGEAKGILRPAAEWMPVELANISFGQGMAATGIQLVTAVSALGNGGKLMRPRLVKRIIANDGEVLREWVPEVVKQVVSERTARTVVDLMRGVTESDGTGKRANIPEYPVAGKTGTGQKPHLRKRGYSEEMWVNTFFGLAPADDPELAIVVLIDEPTGKRHGGGLIAAPTFRRIAEWALPHLGIPSPYATGSRQAWLDPEILAERRKIVEETVDPLAEMAPPVDLSQGGDVPVPDFRGMTMDRARQAASEVGLAIRVHGSGIVLAQSTPAHERHATGTVVTLTFQSRLPSANADIPNDGIDAGPSGYDLPGIDVPLPMAPVPPEALPTRAVSPGVGLGIGGSR